MPPSDTISTTEAPANDAATPACDPTDSAVLPAALGRARRYQQLFLVGSIVVLVLAFVFEVRAPEDVIVPSLGVALPPTCMMRRVTGVNCPGCGLTRSFVCLARGDFDGAWHYNPAGLLFFVVAVAQVPFRSFQLLRISRGHAPLANPWLSGVTWMLLAAAFLQWICRLILPAV